MAWDDFLDPITGNVLLGGYSIPVGVWNHLHSYAQGRGDITDPFEEDDSCWKLAFYLGVGGVESAGAFDIAVEGDPANCSTCGPGGICLGAGYNLDTIDCGDDESVWDKARAHAPYGYIGAYLSHGIFQLYICGQGAAYMCNPALLHDLGIHMAIALPPMGGAIDTYWDDDDVEQSVRTCAQASGHPGWVGDSDYRIANIWIATQAVQPDLCLALEGGVPDDHDPPEPWDMPRSPLPDFPDPPQTIGPSPLPSIPGGLGSNPLPDFPSS